jgi:nucleoside-diphosphate-sugar epimerase
MRVFVTGATGFIGSALVRELIDAGHQVLGLARSEQGAQSLVQSGAEAQRGDLEDLEGLRKGAAVSDAVIHLGFNHDFSKFKQNCEMDRKAIEAMGSVLAGSERPLIVTSGLALLVRNGIATEDAPPVPVSDTYPRASEHAAALLAEQGVRTMVVRLPQVHDTTKQGLITYAVEIAREKGVSAYIGEGQNRWAAVHRLDAARLYRLALEKGDAGARYHALAEEGVTAHDVAAVIGRGLNVPTVSIPAERVAEHFGWFAMFAGLDLMGSSTKTREQLGWAPTGPDLLTDLGNMNYSLA